MNLIEQLNIEYVNLTDTGFEAKMTLTDFHAQPLGFLNGGATLAFAEITAGAASNQLLSDDFFAVGQNINAHHLNPKKSDGFLIARAELLRQGKGSHVWEIRMIDENEKLISQVTVTNAIVPKK